MMSSTKTYWARKPARQTKVNAFAKKALNFLKKKSTILDLGCGFGEDSLFFASRGHKITAVDFSKTSLDRLKTEMKARKIRGITLRQKDISKKLPFTSSSFDAVYAHLSIHYFDDRTTQKIFSEMHRVLKPGGFLFVKCKSVDDPLYGEGKKVGDDTFYREHIRHFFSKPYMQEKLKDFRILLLKKTSSRYITMRSNFIEAVAQKKKSK